MSTLKVICTNRGRHPRARLGPITVDGGGSDVRPRFERGRRHPGVTARTGRGQAVYETRCPRCGRNPRIPEGDLFRITVEYKAAGRDTLDISHLPY